MTYYNSSLTNQNTRIKLYYILLDKGGLMNLFLHFSSFPPRNNNLSEIISYFRQLITLKFADNFLINKVFAIIHIHIIEMCKRNIVSKRIEIYLILLPHIRYFSVSIYGCLFPNDVSALWKNLFPLLKYLLVAGRQGSSI